MALKVLREATSGEMKQALLEAERILGYDRTGRFFMPLTRMARELGIGYHALRYMVDKDGRKGRAQLARDANNDAQSVCGRLVSNTTIGFSIWMPADWSLLDFFLRQPDDIGSHDPRVHFAGCLRGGVEESDPDKVFDLEVAKFRLDTPIDSVDFYRILKPRVDHISWAVRPKPIVIDGMEAIPYYALWFPPDEIAQTSFYMTDGLVGWELAGWCDPDEREHSLPLFKRIASSFQRIPES